MFYQKERMTRKNFSLIELLIVIGIMGALTAMILPHFSDSESAAKDTACDYNNAGTLRYVTMFEASNGVYPSGFHTGTDSEVAGVDVADGVIDAMAVVTRENMKEKTEVLAIDSDDGSYGQSLQEAGIAQLAYEKKAAEDIGTVTAVRAVSADWSDTMNADGSYKSVVDGGAPLQLKGVVLSDWVAAGVAVDWSTLTDDQKRCRKATESVFKIVPLFVATTVDWENAYPYGGGSQESKISITEVGKCPWLDAGSFRYYICLFKVYEDGTAAKLIGTACPECGILDADDF
ncbi:MAG: type II secretion system protein [Lentisphaeria bacterium]